MHFFHYLLIAVIITGCQSQAERPVIIAPAKPEIFFEKMISQAIEYIDSTDMESAYCFLFDVGRPSFENRFLVYNLLDNTIISQRKAAHGRCNQDWLEGRKYSNTPGSGCTSLGKYRIGTSYYGRFGLAYKLYGLDTTNNNALNRFVVLHAHDCVPEPSSPILQLCQSDGCPMVAPGFMKELHKYLQKSRKSVLLWIYDSTQN